MKRNILYIVDSNIQYYSYKNNKLFTDKFSKNSIKENKLFNLENFTNEFSKFLTKNKLQKNIFSEKIDVIINYTYTDIDKMILKDLLEKLSFKNINFIHEENIFDIKKDEVYINCLEESTIIYFQNEFNNTEKIYINNTVFSLNKIVKQIIKFTSSKKIKLFGNNAENMLKNHFITAYIFQNKDIFLIDKLYKMET